MIKEIRLKNFQSHEDTVVKFDEGVNIVKGHSRAGKTAIYRALKLIQTNRPSGNSMLSSWIKGKTKKGLETIEGEFKAEIVLTDGTLTRYKDKNLNTYSVNGKVLKAVATSVPEEVTDILNMNEVNFGGQHDEPFLIRPAGKGGAEASRFLNSLVNFTDADNALTVAEKKKQNANKELSIHTRVLEDTEKALKNYDGLEDAVDIYKELKELTEKLDNATNKKEAIEKAVNKLVNASTALKNIKDVSKLNVVVTQLEKVNKTLENDKNTSRSIKRQLNVLDLANNTLEGLPNIKKMESAIKGYKDIDFTIQTLTSEKTSINRLLQSISKCDTIIKSSSKTDNLSGVLVSINDMEYTINSCKEQKYKINVLLSKIINTNKVTKELDKQLKEQQKDLEGLGTICPKCKGVGVI